MSDFEFFVRSLGLLPRYPCSPDGKWHRCTTESHPRKKNGSFKLALDGNVGWAQDFATMPDPVTWRPDRQSPTPHFDAAALRAASAEARRKQVQATHAAREYHRESDPLIGGHPYLEAHGLDASGCYGFRVDRDGWLVVPMFKDRNLMSIQRISPEGVKRFWKDAPASGASYTIERPHASITVLCEGLATGLAIFNAAPLSRVVVAFTASGLAKVQFPYHGLVTVASDNDHKTICQRHRIEGSESPFEPWVERPGWCLCNPGRCAAETVSKALGCAYTAPQGIHGTDWSDYRAERLRTRLESLPYGSRETESSVRRAVDAEIADAMARAAKFRAPK